MFTMTAREFNQQVGRAQRIADDEPVLVTRQGEPAYVLLSIGEYEQLSGGGPKRSILDELEAKGQLRRATGSVKDLRKFPPVELEPDETTADILADSRGYDRGY